MQALSRTVKGRDMGDYNWLFSLARVLYAADIGVFRVALKGALRRRLLGTQ